MDAQKKHTGKRRVLRILAWTGVGIVGLALVCVLALAGFLLWLTPERLTRIVNEEASEYVNADVRASDVRYTLWSTWPRLVVELDSLHVRSRNFDTLSASERRALPDSADFLLSTGAMRCGLNLKGLMAHKILLRNVEVDSLRLNLVAVTDSLNNFDIVQSSGREEVPYFHIDGLKIKRGGAISYTGVASDSQAKVQLDAASLIPLHGKSDSYALRLDGDVAVNSSGMTILDNFPFELDGDVSMRFKPFGISTDDYRVALGKIKGNVSMDIDMGGEMRLNSFNYRLQTVTLNDIMSALPWLNLPVMQRLHADLGMNLSARLTTPYVFSSAYLPSVAIDFSVPDGEVSYKLADGDIYRLDNAALNGSMIFDGHDPSASYVDIPAMWVSGMGADVDMSARITSLTTEPEVHADVKAKCNLDRLATNVKEMRSYKPHGEVEVDAALEFRLVKGVLYGTSTRLQVNSDRASANVGKYKIAVQGLKLSTSESYADALTRSAAMSDVPLMVDMSARRLRMESAADTLVMDMLGTRGKAYMGRRGAGEVVRHVSALMAGDRTIFESKGIKGDMKGLSVRIDADMLRDSVAVPSFVAPAGWSADNYALGTLAHTPQYLDIKVPAGLARFMSGWRAGVEVRLAGASIATPGFKSANSLRDLNLRATLDTVTLRHVTLRSGASAGRVSGQVSNLRQFLAGAGHAPLRVRLNMDLDTIQINHLARSYTDAHPESAIARGDKEAMAAGIDTIACLVPRNVEADIHFKAAQTRYINLHLYDLDGRLHVADGLAVVDTLHIGSDFGEAALRLHYDTRNVDNMGMDMRVGISDVNVVNFFKNFRKLAKAWPAVNNLSGTLSADVTGRMQIFPNMYIDVPSVWVNGHVRGRDLELKQNKFIRHVTRMLMIPSSDPLHIKDIDVHAAVHTNLIEVFPFTFEVCNYKLGLMGLNNLRGDIYYHIGVEKWPLKMPFGVNVKGTFRHPELRFGGQGWHDRNGAKITVGVDDSNRINMLKMARRGMGEFVHSAAVYNE